MQVILFDFVSTKGSQQQLDVRLELEGTQLGEYFGATVLSVDLNQDGLDELLVGAPQHSFRPDWSSSAVSGDEGRVYIYVNRNGALKSLDAKGSSGFLDGRRSPGARFGTALASAGDFNRDGFTGKIAI